MIHAIVTQTREIVNFENILQIVPLPLTYNGNDVYALTAQPIGVEEISEETLDNCIQLGVYDSEDKLNTVYADFLKWLENSVQPVFTFPAALEE